MIHVVRITQLLLCLTIEYIFNEKVCIVSVVIITIYVFRLPTFSENTKYYEDAFIILIGKMPFLRCEHIVVHTKVVLTQN